MKKQFLMVLALTLIVADGALAQRVGDVVQVGGSNYRVTEAGGGRLVLQIEEGRYKGRIVRQTAESRYDVVNTPLSWTDAKAAAERAGGHLAVITSAEEQKTIEDLLARDGSLSRYWLGGYCESDRVFKWITGEPMNYTNWAPGEPNRSAAKMVIRRTALNRMLPGQWDDEGASSGYIIEWD